MVLSTFMMPYIDMKKKTFCDLDTAKYLNSSYSPSIKMHACVCMCMLRHFSGVQLFAIVWTVAQQAPLPMGILQAAILEWAVMPCSRGSSQLRDGTCVSCIGRWPLYH